ncbi:MAG: serine dehydratase [Flavobacteriales bacterium]|nr:serine dehydratase [Flavobacteriales bacterium]
MNSSKANLEKVHESIKDLIHRTPIMRSDGIDELLGCEVLFKCENFQKIGAFKMRGATYFMHELLNTEIERPKAVVTHSSGNHAQAVALAAKMNGLKAYIVMPKDAPKVKVEAVKGYGGEVHFCEPTLEARESNMERIRAENGAVFIPPFDHEHIILGQSTAAKELIEDTDELDYILAPVGGGGLLAGTALTANAFSPKTKVIGCEPEMADDAYQSFKSGKWQPSKNPKTLADGLKTSLGKLNFDIILEHVNDILCCSEKQMLEAMQLIWERMKIVIEPSAAVPLACIMANREMFKGKRVGLIISGGNLDLGDFFKLLDQKRSS